MFIDSRYSYLKYEEIIDKILSLKENKNKEDIINNTYKYLIDTDEIKYSNYDNIIIQCNEINKKLFSKKWCINSESFFETYNKKNNCKQFIYIDKKENEIYGFNIDINIFEIKDIFNFENEYCLSMKDKIDKLINSISIKI